MSITAPAVPSTSQPAGVFPGSCILPGTVEYSLTNVVNGRSVTVLDIPYMAFRATKHVINVQRSTTVSTSASCGEIPQATLPSIPRTVVVPLLDLNSGQAGVALLFSQGARTQVIISVNNVTALPQPAHIHAGSCDVLGGVTQPLNSVENGWSSTIVNASLVSLRAGGFAINIHKSAFEVSVYMACGDIPTADNSLTFRLAGTGTGAQVGYAGLVGAGDDTLVGVWVTPSSKGLAQPIHVHSGTCSSPGPITQPLTDLVDGRSVTRLAGVSMASLRDGSSIVNLHKSAAEISVYPASASGFHRHEPRRGHHCCLVTEHHHQPEHQGDLDQPGCDLGDRFGQ
ncbi:MAG: hypothetical protein FJ317_03160 [SAR202 cluster bacterium]|nr:hypothetical protein [SAR202 cluster bacterium]